MATTTAFGASTTLNTAAAFPATAAVITPFTAAGTYTIPWWCNKIDIVLLGAGGGGGPGGSVFFVGQNGAAGGNGGVNIYAYQV